MWKKLLVPHDFSPCASRALTTAMALAKVHDAAIILVHVSELPTNLPANTWITPTNQTGLKVRADDYVTEGARQELERVAVAVRQAGIAVSTHAVVGEIARQILRLVEELQADAVVLGTHGRTGLSRLLLGSVAEQVVRGAFVPVLCVRTCAPETPRTREETNLEDELAG